LQFFDGAVEFSRMSGFTRKRKNLEKQQSERKQDEIAASHDEPPGRGRKRSERRASSVFYPFSIPASLTNLIARREMITATISVIRMPPVRIKDSWTLWLLMSPTSPCASQPT